MSQVYMTAKLNLADGTILYPQVSLDNIVASISDPTLVTVATTTNGKVPVTELPVVTVVGDTGSNNNIPTEAAVRALADTKQNTLVAGTGTEIINGSTINAMAVNLNDVVVNNVPNNGLSLEVEGNTMSVVGALAANGSAGVIAGATNGVKLVDGVAQFDVTSVPKKSGDNAGVLVDVGDGLLVADGTASVNISDVDGVLTDDWPVTGTNNYAGIPGEVVTPHNLRGALSVGQAVDVSCPAYVREGWQQISTDGGTTWETITKELVDAAYLSPFSIKMTAGSSATMTRFGWTNPNSLASRFPKFADGLIYLYMMDIKASQICAMAYYDGTVWKSKSIPASDEYVRAYVVTNTGGFWIEKNVAANTTFQLDIKNWRQYEVTALTDEAIAYIAQLPDPDAFFRSNTIFQVRDKYLVKQDMVCPWIYTINMGDDSDLTVGAGLSYKIKYVDDSKPHNVTVDTIPTDAHGWDAHIQMFVKGVSGVSFQPPLVLMDPLTANAGNNLVVKFRNGQALVYVEDTNVGYTVITATGIADGSLAYGFTYTPSSNKDDKYIIFGTVVDGVTCDFGTATAVYATQAYTINVLGNGIDNTSITGTLEVPSYKNVVLQDLTITGSTFYGDPAASGVDLSNVVLDNVDLTVRTTKVSGPVTIPEGSTVTGHGAESFLAGSSELLLNGRISNKKVIHRLIRSDGTGVIDGANKMGGPIFVQQGYYGAGQDTFSYSNITVTGGSSANSGGGAWLSQAKTVTFDHVVFEGNVAAYASRDIYVDNITDCLYLYDCSFHDLIPITLNWKCANVVFHNCTFTATGLLISTANNGAPGWQGKITISGNNKMNGHFQVNNLQNNLFRWDLYIATDAVLDLSEFSTTWALSKNSLIRYEVYRGNPDTTGEYVYIGDNVTILALGGSTASIDAMRCRTLYAAGGVDNERDGYVTVSKSDVSTWKAKNMFFAVPVDGYNAGVVQLTGATFSANALVDGNAGFKGGGCIFLPADSTNKFDFGSSVANTNVGLEAPIILVGSNPNTPSGTASIVTLNGTKTYQGIATIVRKDGYSNFTTTAISDVTTANGLDTALSGSNVFIRIASGVTASASYTATKAVAGKSIITTNYEPLFYGSFTFNGNSAMTVDPDNKVITITSSATTFLNPVVLPEGVRLVVSDGKTCPVTVRGAGVIDLDGGYAVSPTTTTTVRGTTITGGALTTYGGGMANYATNVAFYDVVLTGNTSTVAGGGFYAASGPVLFDHCTISDNVTPGYGGGVYLGNATAEFKYCTISGNRTESMGTGIALNGSTASLTGCIITGNTGGYGSITDSGPFYSQAYSDTYVMGGCVIKDNVGTSYSYRISNAYLYFKNYNKMDAPIYGSGKVVLNKNAVLDFTGNTNTFAIQATTIKVNPGTAYMICGTDGVLRSIGVGIYTSISNAGVGSGKQTASVVSVTTSDTTAGTLYYACTTATDPYIFFDEATDGSQFTLSLGGSTINRAATIYGNGVDRTKISGTLSIGGFDVSVLDCDVTNLVVPGLGKGAVITIEHCKATNPTTALSSYNNSRRVSLHKVFVTINDDFPINESYAASAYYVSVSNCVFTDNKTVNDAGYDIATGTTTITGSTFGRGVRIMFGTVTIQDCTFNQSTVRTPQVVWVGDTTTVSFKGSVRMDGKVVTAGTGIVTFAANTTLDFRSCKQETPISCATTGCLVIPSGVTVTVRKYGGGTDATIVGPANYTTMTRTGAVS